MQETSANLSTDFLFPKLHGMWARSFVGERLRHLAQSGSREALHRALAPLGIDVPGRREFQRRLTAHFVKEMVSVKRLLDRRTAAFYGAAIERFFFADLKTVMHVHFFPEHDVDIAFLLHDAPGLPRFDPERIAEAKSLHQLFQQIPPHPVRNEILPLLAELEDGGDILKAECQLDRMFYERFQAAANAVPLALRGAAGQLVGTEIDVANIVMILRNLELYHLPPETMSDLTLREGLHVSEKRLAALSACTTRSAAIELLPGTYRNLLDPLVDAELYMSENALWNLHYRMAVKNFSDFDHPGLSVLAFPFLKRAELLNVGRIFEGLHFGLESRDIMTMMIGVNHV